MQVKTVMRELLRKTKRVSLRSRPRDEWCPVIFLHRKVAGDIPRDDEPTADGDAGGGGDDDDCRCLQ